MQNRFLVRNSHCFMSLKHYTFNENAASKCACHARYHSLKLNGNLEKLVDRHKIVSGLAIHNKPLNSYL